MNFSEAAHILKLDNPITPEKVKKAYRSAAMRYHPDRNPAGDEMMKIINAAFDLLKEFSGDIKTEEQVHETDYSEALEKALLAIMGLEGLEIEICGAWVWVSGSTKTHKDILKGEGFRYASKKKRWYFRPDGWRSKSRGSFSMEEIRETYGTDKPAFRKRKHIDGNRANTWGGS